MDTPLYSTTSYTIGSGEPGLAVVQVVGCNTTTELLVPAGSAQDSHTYRNAVAQAIWPVLDAIDPQSPNYDLGLDADYPGDAP